MKITYKEYQEFWDEFRELAKQHGWMVSGG